MVRPADPGGHAALPSAVLDTPYPKEPIPDLVNQILGAGDWLNVSHYLAAGMDIVFGFNPGERFATWIVGDWQQVSTAASALDQLAEYAIRFASQLNTHAGQMLESWEGNAATSAATYFDTLAVAVDKLAEPLHGLAGRYQATAAGMQEMAASVTSILETLADELIELAMRTAAAAALAETNPTAAGLLHSYTYYAAYKCIALWTKAVQAYSDALTIAQGAIGACAGYLSLLRNFDDVAVPHSYDHPDVKR